VAVEINGRKFFFVFPAPLLFAELTPLRPKRDAVSAPVDAPESPPLGNRILDEAIYLSLLENRARMCFLGIICIIDAKGKKTDEITRHPDR
jgi:hypothetical protein